jgi:hypothetical protein
VRRPETNEAGPKLPQHRHVVLSRVVRAGRRVGPKCVFKQRGDPGVVRIAQKEAMAIEG